MGEGRGVVRNLSAGGKTRKTQLRRLRKSLRREGYSPKRTHRVMRMARRVHHPVRRVPRPAGTRRYNQTTRRRYGVR